MFNQYRAEPETELRGNLWFGSGPHEHDPLTGTPGSGLAQTSGHPNF